MPDFIPSSPFSLMVLRSFGFDINPSSIKRPKIFMSRMAPSRHQRLVVSGFTPRPLRPVIRV
jgi:hypothetical protein